jgi:hypothetical protein
MIDRPQMQGMTDSWVVYRVRADSVVYYLRVAEEV